MAELKRRGGDSPEPNTNRSSLFDRENIVNPPNTPELEQQLLSAQKKAEHLMRLYAMFAQNPTDKDAYRAFAEALREVLMGDLSDVLTIMGAGIGALVIIDNLKGNK